MTQFVAANEIQSRSKDQTISKADKKEEKKRKENVRARKRKYLKKLANLTATITKTAHIKQDINQTWPMSHGLNPNQLLLQVAR